VAAASLLSSCFVGSAELSVFVVSSTALVADALALLLHQGS